MATHLVPLFILGILVALAGCATPRPAPRDAAGARAVVGRLLVYRDGRPVALTASGSPLRSTLHPDGPLTAVVAYHLDSRQRIRIPIAAEDGWFLAALPPGAYALAVDHFIWSLETPVRFQAPAHAGPCYLGSLGIELFARAGATAAPPWRRGGAVPASASTFRLYDQRGAAQRQVGRALGACPMQLTHAPPRARR